MPNTRIRPDSPIWVFCCCGCLPIIGILKGLLIVIPLTLYCTIAAAAISLFHLPKTIAFTYWSILKNQIYGPNVTCLALILLPIPLLAYPVVATLSALIASFVGGLFGPTLFTFTNDSPIWTGGFRELFKYANDSIAWLHKSHGRDYFDFLQQLRYKQLEPNEHKWDISLGELVVALIVGLIGLILDGVLFFLIATIYLIPATGRAYYALWGFYWGLFWDRTMEKWCAAMCFPIFLLANVVLAPVCVLCYALVLACGFGVGLYSSAVSYQFGLSIAFKWQISQTVRFEQTILAFVMTTRLSSPRDSRVYLTQCFQGLEPPEAVPTYAY